MFVVDRRFGARYLPEGTVGAQLAFGGNPPADDAWPTVVGEAAPITHLVLIDARRPTLAYQSYYRSPTAGLSFFMRSSRSSNELISDARRVIAEIDPGIPVYLSGGLDTLIQESLRDWRAILRLGVLFGMIALLLALAGIYGIQVNNLNSERRTNAIRVALGATPISLLLRALLRGIMPVAAGVAIGIVLAALVTPLFQEQLMSVNPHDLFVFTVVALSVPIVALAVLLAPALTAARCDPGRVLHEE